jgi:hypothetical protein
MPSEGELSNKSKADNAERRRLRDPPERLRVFVAPELDYCRTSLRFEENEGRRVAAVDATGVRVECRPLTAAFDLMTN